MRLRSLLPAALMVFGAIAGPATAEPTPIVVRVLAHGAKFLGGYQAGARIVVSDADTGEVLVRGLTTGTTGDTQRILSRGRDTGGLLASPEAAAFRTTLDLDRPRRLTISAQGPLSQPQAAVMAATTLWVLPGHDLASGDGLVLELSGLIVDVATPVAYQRVKLGATVPLRASVTMLCGCALSETGPWRAGDTEVEGHVTANGGAQQRLKLSFDPATATFGADFQPSARGLYEVEIRAWMGPTHNAGVSRVAFFVE